MLKKKFRLKNRSSFRYVYKKGKSVSCATVVLQFVPTKSLKIGFSVSKKIGNSVERNRVKRRLRECVRAFISRIAPKYNCVFVARAAALDADFESFKGDVYSLLSRAGVLKEEVKIEAASDNSSKIL